MGPVLVVVVDVVGDEVFELALAPDDGAVEIHRHSTQAPPPPPIHVQQTIPT